MLPGGMTILGLFFVGDINLFSNSTAMTCLKNILSAVDNFAKENEFYFIDRTTTPKIVLNYIDEAKYVVWKSYFLCYLLRILSLIFLVLHSFICKQFNASQGGYHVDSVECTWSNSNWHRISCYYDFQHLLPLYVKSISNVILHEKIMVRIRTTGLQWWNTMTCTNYDYT